MKIENIIIDIDNTIANLDHRLHLIKSDNPDYDNFEKNMIYDSPINHTIHIINLLIADGAKPIFITARPIKYEKETLLWLSKYITKDYDPNIWMLMRYEDDDRDDHILKEDLLDIVESDLGVNPKNTVVFEDRDIVVDMYRSKNYITYQVDYGDY